MCKIIELLERRDTLVVNVAKGVIGTFPFNSMIIELNT